VQLHRENLEKIPRWEMGNQGGGGIKKNISPSSRGGRTPLKRARGDHYIGERKSGHQGGRGWLARLALLGGKDQSGPLPISINEKREGGLRELKRAEKKKRLRGVEKNPPLFFSPEKKEQIEPVCERSQKRLKEWKN